MRKGIDCKGRTWEERRLSGYMKDITGQRFGRLVALFPVTYNNRAYWLCQCDCGNKLVILCNALTSGNTESCGCLHSEIVTNNWIKFRETQDIIGKKFNRLTVVEFIGIEDEQAIYRFQCDCGNEIITSLNCVKSGNTKSCGCLFDDFINSYKQDIIGKKFGRLLVLEYAGVNKRGENEFKCRCDCGKEVVISRNVLTTGRVKSCGCLRSIGENNIKDILDKTDINYIQQYTFSDLVSLNNVPLPYDFGILDNNQQIIRLIEFDGKQHEQPYEYFGGEEKFKKIQENDVTKNQYALSHNIPLVRIPYNKRDNMILEDLLGDQFLIKGER